MEKIIIKEISEDLSKEGRDSFWGVVLGDGRKATVWDANIAANIKMNLNWPTEAEVKQQGKYLNIREFKGERQAPKETMPEIPAPKLLTTDGSNQDHLAGKAMEAPVEVDNATATLFEVKSSVKLEKNTKGICWKIKVVKGEELLINGLMEAAVTAHKALETEFPTPEKKDDK